MCKSEHLKGVAAGTKVYDPGNRKACVACQTSRVVVKKTTINRKKGIDRNDAGYPIVTKNNGKTMDFSRGLQNLINDSRLYFTSSKIVTR
jgi:hypothetical protein